MKITHLCLCGPFTDKALYQENLLTKYHKKLGHDVSIITSQYTWNNKGKIVKVKSKTYYNEHGLKVIRLPSYEIPFLNFKLYKNLYKSIENEKPDIIFMHGIQFLNLKQVVKYVKKHTNVRLYVDNHADVINSARNWLSKNIKHKMIWRHNAKIIEPYTTKFYGVLPSRVNFLIEMYKLPPEKVELLVMGSDDEMVEKAKNPSIKNNIRKQYNVKSNDFLVITGGKIDIPKKQVLLLMEAIKQIDNNRIKLLIFGSVVDELKNNFQKLVDGKKIQYIGWLGPQDCYNHLAASDLAVFPGGHSVFWEQTVALGIPVVAKYWEGTDHIDLGGNCKFLYQDSVDEIKEIIINIFEDRELYNQMKEVAEKKGMKEFSYKKIAEKSIRE